MRRVLVTGATGFIGRGTLAPLLGRGFEVHAVTSRQPPHDPGEVEWHEADLLAADTAAELISELRPTHLLHLAWYAEPGLFWSSPENLRWVEASLRLLKAFTDHGGARAVVAGSCAEYGWTERTVCHETTTPCTPATLYGTCKHALRLIAEAHADQHDLSLAWGRVFFTFGPHEHPARLGGSVARSLVLGQEAACSHGRQVRDFLYSEDLAAAFAALLDSEATGPVNLASGQPTRIRDLVEALAQAAGRPDLVRLGARPAPAGEPEVLVADVGRLRDEVGFSALATLPERAVDTIDWWRAQLTAADPHPESA